MLETFKDQVVTGDYVNAIRQSELAQNVTERRVYLVAREGGGLEIIATEPGHSPTSARTLLTHETAPKGNEVRVIRIDDLLKSTMTGSQFEDQWNRSGSGQQNQERFQTAGR